MLPVVPWELRSPTGLWLLALLVPLLALYILKIRRERHSVSSTWLWAAARRDLLAQSPFKRLVGQLPLIIQALAIALLALASSGPALRGTALLGDQIAIIVDVSASMSAHSSNGRARIEAARVRARRMVEALGPGAQAMIIEADQDARIASPLDRDKVRLVAAVDRIRVREVEGKLAPALAVASDRLRPLAGTKRIVIITDGAVSDGETLGVVRMPVEIVRVGNEIENAGIVRVDIRRGVDPLTRREQVQAFALVANYGRTRRDLFVTLQMRNVSEPLASRRIVVAPGERAPVVLTFEPTPNDEGSGLIVALSPGDALRADDRAYGRVPASRKLPVVIAPANANPWLTRALSADPDVDLVGAKLEELDDPSISEDSLVVIEGSCPKAAPGMDLLIVNPPEGPCRTATVGKPVMHPTITSWTEGDARLRFLSFEGVHVLKAHLIETDGPHEALVHAREGTLIADISVPGRSGTLIGFDVADSNWPLKAAFVLFVRNVVEVARANRARNVVGAAHTGDAVRVRLPPEVTEATLITPNEERRELKAQNGLLVIPEVSRAGFYDLSWRGPRGQSLLVAANLTSERESNVSDSLTAALGSGQLRSGGKLGSSALTDWSFVLAAIALALIVFDVYWLTRTNRAALGGKLREGAP